jgi:hypothetical protein
MLNGIEWSFCQVVDISGWTWRRLYEDFDNCEAYFLSGLTGQDVAEGVVWNGPCVEVFRIYESPVFSLESCRPTRYWGVTIYRCSPSTEEELGDTKDERYNSLEEAKKAAEAMLALFLALHLGSAR